MTQTSDDRRPLKGFKAGDLVAKYVAIRDKKDALVKAHKEAVKTLDLQLGMLEGEFNARMNVEGVDQISSPVATVYYQSSARYKCNDWDAFLNYAEATGKAELMQRRLSSKAMKEHIEENDGVLPPGITAETYRDVRVRKS